MLCCRAVALGKFNEGVVSYDEEGEVELDLEKVDFASLMEVRRRHCHSTPSDAHSHTACTHVMTLQCRTHVTIPTADLNTEMVSLVVPTQDGVLTPSCRVRLQVDAYIRQLNGLPPREPPQQVQAAAVAAPADTAEPSEGNARGNRGTVQAEQVRSAGCMPAVPA